MRLSLSWRWDMEVKPISKTPQLCKTVRLLAPIMKRACKGKIGSIVRGSDLCALVDRTSTQAALSLAHSAARVRRTAIRDIDAR